LCGWGLSKCLIRRSICRVGYTLANLFKPANLSLIFNNRLLFQTLGFLKHFEIVSLQTVLSQFLGLL